MAVSCSYAPYAVENKNKSRSRSRRHGKAETERKVAREASERSGHGEVVVGGYGDPLRRERRARLCLARRGDSSESVGCVGKWRFSVQEESGGGSAAAANLIIAWTGRRSVASSRERRRRRR